MRKTLTRGALAAVAVAVLSVSMSTWAGAPKFKDPVCHRVPHTHLCKPHL